MKKPRVFTLATLSMLAGVGVPAVAQEKPNVIVVIADDLGYGDVSAYGGALKTPNFDRLANSGLRFTRGYAASATSSPSRYALLTGVYPWRKNVNILPGDSPLIIPTDKPTIATMFQKCGYRTCAIGKWHLGLGRGNSNWNRKISPGPQEIGFDHSFIMAATNDRVPCVYFSDGYVVNRDPADPISVSYRKNFPGEPTGKTHPHLLKQQPAPNHGHADSIVNGISRIGFMKGGEKARWVDEEMAAVFAGEAHAFIRANKNRPLFMYYALHQPHVPRVPNAKFAGKSGLGPRGDAILEADAQVGELLDLLEAEKLDKNTLIVFTSDNGPVLNDGYADLAEELAAEKNYRPSGALRGGKYSLFEGGTRVPFIVSWQGRVAPGVSDVPVAQLDLFASLASLVGGNVPVEADSENHLDVLLGKNKTQGRKNFVVEATGRLAYREGDFLYIPARPKLPSVAWLTKIENGNAKQDALYNVADDPAQQKNLAETLPEKLRQMRDAYLDATDMPVQPLFRSRKF
ncbi:MAG: sulfatase-like hydrolase/transferase [Opitutales bacterium]|nr:sulfatase-like hydrolase/transferase [Opitutales bacterium]